MCLANPWHDGVVIGQVNGLAAGLPVEISAKIGTSLEAAGHDYIIYSVTRNAIDADRAAGKPCRAAAPHPEHIAIPVIVGNEC